MALHSAEGVEITQAASIVDSRAVFTLGDCPRLSPRLPKSIAEFFRKDRSCACCLRRDTVSASLIEYRFVRMPISVVWCDYPHQRVTIANASATQLGRQHSAAFLLAFAEVQMFRPTALARDLASTRRTSPLIRLRKDLGQPRQLRPLTDSRRWQALHAYPVQMAADNPGAAELGYQRGLRDSGAMPK